MTDVTEETPSELALATAHNTIEDLRIAARRAVEATAQSHQNARHHTMERLVKVYGDLTDATFLSGLRLVLETGRSLELAKAREEAFSKATVLVRKAITEHVTGQES